MFYRDFFCFCCLFILFLIRSLSRTFAMDARVHLINMEFHWTKRMNAKWNGRKKLGKRTHKTDDHSERERGREARTKNICDNCQASHLWTIGDGNKRINLSFLNSLHSYKMLQTTVIQRSRAISLSFFLLLADGLCSSNCGTWSGKEYKFYRLNSKRWVCTYVSRYALVPSANSSAFCTSEN